MHIITEESGKKVLIASLLVAMAIFGFTSISLLLRAWFAIDHNAVVDYMDGASISMVLYLIMTALYLPVIRKRSFRQFVGTGIVAGIMIITFIATSILLLT